MSEHTKGITTYWKEAIKVFPVKDGDSKIISFLPLHDKLKLKF